MTGYASRIESTTRLSEMGKFCFSARCVERLEALQPVVVTRIVDVLERIRMKTTENNPSTLFYTDKELRITLHAFALKLNKYGRSREVRSVEKWHCLQACKI